MISTYVISYKSSWVLTRLILSSDQLT